MPFCWHFLMLPDDMKIYITSNDDMPLKIVSDISSEERVGYYKELYIEVEDANKNLAQKGIMKWECV